MAPNEMALYPNWLILYVLRIIIPMLILVIVALFELLAGPEGGKVHSIGTISTIGTPMQKTYNTVLVIVSFLNG